MRSNDPQSQVRILAVVGTRPEAIKMAPVVRALKSSDRYSTTVLSTGQHREMLDDVLRTFKIVPDVNLDLMQPGQSLHKLTSRALELSERVLAEYNPDLVLVQGDTTTTLSLALAAFYSRIPVAHVEAGLRTWNIDSPFPEEANRTLTSRIAALHLAPTKSAASNLLQEGLAPQSITVTGNTVIDAIRQVIELDAQPQDPQVATALNSDYRKILVTLHRRESWGTPIENAAAAMKDVLDHFDDVQVIFPMHRNPRVRDTVIPILGGLPRATLMEPARYADFVKLMANATAIVTDSGGVQEESSYLKAPLFVLRDVTERPEAIQDRSGRLLGTQRTTIATTLKNFLGASSDSPDSPSRQSSPFGDGHAAARILAAIDHYFGFGPRPDDFQYQETPE